MSPIKTVLVTGGAGYIGSHCVLELLNAGYDIIAVDNFANAVAGGDKAVSLQRIEKLTGKTVTFYPVDITDKTQVANLFKKHKIDCVIHLAAFKNVRESVQKPLEYYTNNLEGLFSLLLAMKEAGVKNFVFSSSCTVYGDSVFEKLPVDENALTGKGITSPYGQTKYFTEQILKDLVIGEPDWNVISLRYFNPVGAHSTGIIGEDPKGIPQNLMPYVSQVAVGRLPVVPVFGNDFATVDGSGMRDYIHVVDVAEGHVAAVNKMKEGKIGLKVYNLGTGQGTTVLQMIAGMERACGKKVPYEIQPRKPGDVPAVYCDPSLAAKDLGWKAKRSIDDICKDLWTWQSKNPQGYE